MRAFRYSFDEAVASLWRGRRSGLLSMATITVALFVLGAFLLITSNLDRLSGEWSRAAEISVYVDDDISPADRGDVERLLAPGANSPVASFEFVSKDEALRRFKTTFADLAGSIESVDGNPLPASYEVRLSPSPEAQAPIESLVEKLRDSAGVADVRFDRTWLDRLLSAINVVRGAGMALGLILTVAAALTVANVVRLALYARRDELDIMQLVGAPQMYIRGPFVMEGLLQGGIGATVAVALLAALFLATSARYLTPLASAVNLSSIRFLSPGLCVMLLGGGMLVGCLGGVVAAASGRSVTNS
jgi:cell division transport system permease protein